MINITFHNVSTIQPNAIMIRLSHLLITFTICLVLSSTCSPNGDDGEPVILDAFPVILDAFVVNGGFLAPQKNRIYLNDGSGSFMASDASNSSQESQGVALGDLNGDGHLDAFVVNGERTEPQKNRVYLGDGSGGFTVSDASADEYASSEVALGDLDADGDLDAFVVNDGQAGHRSLKNRIYLNDGSGSFTASEASADTYLSSGVALGDLD